MGILNGACMEIIVVIVIFMLVNYIDSLYFSIQALELLREVDYENDKEFMDEILKEIGIKDLDDIDNKIIEKIEWKSFWFYILLILTFIVFVVDLIWVIIYGNYSYKQILICAAFVIIPTIVMFLDNLLNFYELCKMKDLDYRKTVEKEQKRLIPIRIFYCISSIIIIIVTCFIETSFKLKTTNENYDNIAWSVVLIYLGGMGLVAKIMFLKVPLKLDGKLAPYINTLVLGIGLYLLTSSLINILNI